MGLSTCAATPCGQMYIEYKALKELNMKGIYPPNQIQEVVDKNWNSEVGKNESTCDKEQAKAIATKTVNYLGECGNGITFNEKDFET